MTDALDGNQQGCRYHVGWPPDLSDAVSRLRSGLPLYLPSDPKTIDQEPYIRFARERGPNSHA